MLIKFKKKGVTLIEVLIYTAMVSAGLLVLVNISFMITSFSQEFNIKKTLIQNADFVNANLMRDLSEAYEVSTPADNVFSPSVSFVSTASGSVVYIISEGRLWRNSVPVSSKDAKISAETSEAYGFRKINSSIDWRLLIEPLYFAISGTNSAQIIKGTVFMPNLL